MKNWKLFQKSSGEYFYVTTGEKSRHFYYAREYKDGFAVVKVLKTDKYFRFRDDEGNLSCYFKIIKDYEEGFALVLPQSNKWKYRDMLGRISKGKTKSGVAFYKLYKGILNVEDLDYHFFSDDIFVQGVIKLIKDKYTHLAQDKVNDLKIAILSIINSKLEIVNKKRIKAYKKCSSLLKPPIEIQNPERLVNEEYYKSIIQKLIDRYINIASKEPEKIKKEIYNVLQREIVALNEKLYDVVQDRYLQSVKNYNEDETEGSKLEMECALEELENLKRLLGKTKNTSEEHNQDNEFIF